MVFAYTRYRNGSHPGIIDEGSAEISSITISNALSRLLRYHHAPDDIAEYDYPYKDLASMITRSPAKIPKICVDCIFHMQEPTPEYLSLLVSILNKADCLEIYYNLGGDAAYACFMCSMLQQNGLRELSVRSSDAVMSTYQAKLLFEGIASSQSLEKLELNFNFPEPAEAGAALANALNRNHSLTTLDLYVNLEDGGTELRDLFQAAITDKRIHNFSIHPKQGHQHLPFDAMAEVLCTDQCTVKELDCTRIEPTARPRSTGPNEHNENLQNTSVTFCSLGETSLGCFRIMETVSLFRSIKELHLCFNQISDLSPLDPLLVGDNLTLQSLDLMRNEISENDALEFFRKVPKMTCLRNVTLTWNPFIDSSESWMDVLAEVAWQNRSLECINCVNDDYGYPDEVFAETNVPLSLNRGGRRALEIECSKPLPVSLWPNVLERAAKLSYFRSSDSVYFPPTLDATRPDVVFWLLKENVLGSCLYGRLGRF